MHPATQYLGLFDEVARACKDSTHSLERERTTRGSNQFVPYRRNWFRDAYRIELAHVRRQRTQELHWVWDEPKDVDNKGNAAAGMYTARFDVRMNQLDLWHVFSRKCNSLPVAIDSHESSIGNLQ
jgi:hypothetical protein